MSLKSTSPTTGLLRASSRSFTRGTASADTHPMRDCQALLKINPKCPIKSINHSKSQKMTLRRSKRKVIYNRKRLTLRNFWKNQRTRPPHKKLRPSTTSLMT